MIFILLFLEFFKIGICAFGGGLATIPFLEELCVARPEWFSHSDLINMIAVSESTPGAIGINMSTYVGYQAVFNAYDGNVFLAFFGGVCATLGFISPSIIIILIISQFLAKFKDSKLVKWAFYGLRAASIGLIIAAAYSILKVSIIDVNSFTTVIDNMNTTSIKDILVGISDAIIALFGNFKAIALGLFIGIIFFKYKKHPILYIVIAAILGIILQM